MTTTSEELTTDDDILGTLDDDGSKYLAVGYLGYLRAIEFAFDSHRAEGDLYLQSFAERERALLLARSRCSRAWVGKGVRGKLACGFFPLCGNTLTADKIKCASYGVRLRAGRSGCVSSAGVSTKEGGGEGSSTATPADMISLSAVILLWMQRSQSMYIPRPLLIFFFAFPLIPALLFLFLSC